MQTLLQKAAAVNRQRSVGRSTKQEMDLALAWLQDRVSLGQVAVAIGKNDGSNSYNWLARVLRDAFRNSRLRVRR